MKRRRLDKESEPEPSHFNPPPANVVVPPKEEPNGDETLPHNVTMHDDPVVVHVSQQQEQQLTSRQQIATSSVSASTSKRIFIGNLHPRVAKAHLEKLLLPYWSKTKSTTASSSSSSSNNTTKMMDIRLCFHPNGQPRGYAFCEFQTAHDAQAAIHALHGRKLLSRTLVVQEAKMNASNTTTSDYYSNARRGQQQQNGTTVTPSMMPRKEMKREDINNKIAKLKRALQENSNP